MQRISLTVCLPLLAGVLACDAPAPPIAAERASVRESAQEQTVVPVLPSTKALGPTLSKETQRPAVAKAPNGADRGSEGWSPAYPQEFHVTSMQGTSYRPAIRGNTIQALRAAHRQGIEYVEVDLYLTLDGVLVTTHEPGVTGCGDVRAMNSAPALGCRGKRGLRVAALQEVLEIPFGAIYLDLKETKRLQRAEPAVRAAAEAIVAAERQTDTVLMVYQATNPVRRIIRRHGLRAGLKGYPTTDGDAELLVHQASTLGFEMACVKAEKLSAELVRDSIDLGVWHLPWSVNPGALPHWKELAEAGAGGLIVLHYAAVRDAVAPHWVNRWPSDHAPEVQQGT